MSIKIGDMLRVRDYTLKTLEDPWTPAEVTDLEKKKFWVVTGNGDLCFAYHDHKKEWFKATATLAEVSAYCDKYEKLADHYGIPRRCLDVDCVIHTAIMESKNLRKMLEDYEESQDVLDRWRHAAVLTDTPLMQATCKALRLI